MFLCLSNLVKVELVNICWEDESKEEWVWRGGFWGMSVREECEEGVWGWMWGRMNVKEECEDECENECEEEGKDECENEY